jgi:protein phosphatase
LTEDHSLLNDYLKAKTLTEKEIQNFPHKNIIVRALGMKDGVMVDMSQHEIQPEDVFLGCSDGLSGMLSDAQIFDVIKTCSTDLEKACEKLITMSNDAGGMDNITAVLAYVHEV